MINTQILEYKNYNKEINKQIDIFEKQLNELENSLKNFFNEEKEKLEDLKDNYHNISYYNIEKMKVLLNKFKFKEKSINELKLNCELLLKSEEKILSLIFISLDQNIHYSAICKNKDKFSKIESILYDKYPEYKNAKNYFIVNGHKIDISKNLDENNIKNNDIIILKTN